MAPSFAFQTGLSSYPTRWESRVTSCGPDLAGLSLLSPSTRRGVEPPVSIDTARRQVSLMGSRRWSLRPRILFRGSHVASHHRGQAVAPNQGLRELPVKHSSSVARGKPPPPSSSTLHTLTFNAPALAPGQNGPPKPTSMLGRGKPRHFACQAPPPRRSGSPSQVGKSWQGWSSKAPSLAEACQLWVRTWAVLVKKVIRKEIQKKPGLCLHAKQDPKPKRVFLEIVPSCVRGDGGGVAGAVFVSQFLQSPRARDVQSLQLLTHP